MKKFFLISILFLASVGVVDTSYLLFAEMIRGVAMTCPDVTIGRFYLGNCGLVLSSPYSYFFGLPLALYGLGAYLLFLILVFVELSGKWPLAKKLLLYLSGFGFLTSLYFTYLQVFVIEAICIYCVTSALTMALLFALSAAYNTKYSENARA